MLPMSCVLSMGVHQRIGTGADPLFGGFRWALVVQVGIVSSCSGVALVSAKRKCCHDVVDGRTFQQSEHGYVDSVDRPEFCGGSTFHGTTIRPPPAVAASRNARTPAGEHPRTKNGA